MIEPKEPKDYKVTFVYTIGAWVGITLIASIAMLREVWIWGIVAIIAVFVLFGVIKAVGLIILTHHQFKMLEIERAAARIVQVPQDHYVYHTGAQLVTAQAVGLLPSGKPETPPQKWQVYTEHTDRETNTIQLLSLDLPPDALHRFAGAIARGDSFAERAATGAGLTQQQFYDIRDELLSRNMAVWKHPHRRQQGVELTPSAKALFRGIAASPLPRNGC